MVKKEKEPSAVPVEGGKEEKERRALAEGEGGGRASVGRKKKKKGRERGSSEYMRAETGPVRKENEVKKEVKSPPMLFSSKGGRRCVLV